MATFSPSTNAAIARASSTAPQSCRRRLSDVCPAPVRRGKRNHQPLFVAGADDAAGEDGPLPVGACRRRDLHGWMTVLVTVRVKEASRCKMEVAIPVTLLRQ